MAKKSKYVKCGPNAFSFADLHTGFHLSKGQVKELETLEQRRSGKVKKALQGGHLVLATEAEFKAFNNKESASPEEKKKIINEEKSFEDKLKEMKKTELVAHYKKTYEVDDDEVKEFEALSKPDMVDELLELAKDDDDE